MARWQLKVPHYLMVEGTKWEYSEVDRITGRPKRVQFNVPRYLDPGDPADQTVKVPGFPEEGKLNVTNGGTHEANDVVFIGDPGPDMIPLDDEAKAISASFSKKWVNPIEDLPVNMTYADRLLENLQSEVAQLQSQTKPSPAGDLSELKGLMVEQSKMMTDLLTALGAMAKSQTLRRV